MTYDFLIVGAGFFGSICARELTDAGYKCLVIDKRDHFGGRLAEYRYYDMHQVVESALNFMKKII